MRSTSKLKEELNSGALDQRLADIYGCTLAETDFYKNNFLRCLSLFEERFGPKTEAALFSAPGRTEIGGNHTDHQHGMVLAGSVNLDIIGVAAPSTHKVIRVQSEGYPIDEVDIAQPGAFTPKASEKDKAIALVRGVAAGLADKGHTLSGMEVYTISNVPKGSGISSSAAFEILLGNVMNHLCCKGEESVIDLAKIGQRAENEFFGKPSGLLDQMACAVGGIVGMDFADRSSPQVFPIDFHFSQSGHALCVIDSGADHADLTHEYAAIPAEMKAVANFFGEDYLRKVDEESFWKRFDSVREAAGDRAMLRAAHFFADNKRALDERLALEKGDFEGFLKLVNESGISSFQYLQNIYAIPFAGQPFDQSVAVTLCLAQKFLKGRGASRVHGGGFAGTVQAFVPLDMLEEFKANVDSAFGRDACKVLTIRPIGGTKVWPIPQ